jgi:hypothetical protein
MNLQQALNLISSQRARRCVFKQYSGEYDFPGCSRLR